MYIETYYCEYCGKHFFSKHYTGGYIDHYRNFAQNKEYFGNDIDDDVMEICFKGNEIREIDDIKERLFCYMQWENISDKFKEEVSEHCHYLIDKIEKAEQKAKQLVEGLTMLERRYLILEAEDNCGTPYGNEDGKLWTE